MSGGGDLVGSAYVEINVDASPGAAELDKLMAKADRDFAELGRKEAEASFDINTAKFDAKIDKVKGEIADLEDKKARVSVELKGDLEKEIAEAKAELKQLSREKVTVRVDAKQVKAANKETRLLSDARALDEKHALGQASAERKLSNERSRGTLEATKARAEIAKLGDEYERLRGRQKSIEKSSARVFSPKSVGTAESERRALERVTAEAEHVKTKIESLGGSVEGLDARMGKNTSLLDRWLSRLGDTSVRIGPITTSIKGLATGLGLLGPMLFELGGGAADLIGFLGSGIAGAAAVGGAGLAGFATSAVGVSLVIKPMVKEFGEVKKAEEALTKAQLKYGKGSKQVKTAQEQLNHELKGVSPIAKAAIQDYGKLGGEWAHLTAPAKPAVFNAFGQGIKTVQALLPEFASESVATTKAAAQAWDGWMKSLRSSGAKKILGEVMSNFRDSIPGIASGLGDIGAMLGHIAAAASNFLPGLSHGFADWAKNLEESVGSGGKLVHTIGGMVNNMRDFGHLAQDTGSFVIHFFGAAAGAGDQLNNSLDHTVQSWDKWAQSREGEESLKSFFKESAVATEDFFSVLGGAVKLLFEFSRATAPIANGLLTVVTWIGNLVSAADKLVGVKTVLQGIGIALGGLFVGNKIANVVSSVGALAAKIGVIGGAEDVATASIDANTAALEANSAAMAENAAAAGADGAAKSLEGVAVAGDDAALALGGAGSEAAGLSALLAPEVLIPAAVIGGLVLLATQVEGVGSSFEEAGKAGTVAQEEWSAQGKKTEQSFKGVNDAYHHREKATNELKDAEQQTVKAMEKHGATSKQAVAAAKKQESAERTAINTQKAAYAASENNVKQTEKEVDVAKQAIRAHQDEVKAASIGYSAAAGGKAGFIASGPAPHEAENIAAAVKRVAAAEREAANASREMSVANIVNERSAKNLAPISDKTAKSLQTLSKSIGVAATKKIGNFVNPSDVSKVANLSSKLTKLGQGATVKKIDVKSTGANQTIAQLQRLNKQSEKVSGGVTKLTVKSNDTQANQSLRRLSQQAQAIMGSRPVLKILGNADNAEQAIRQLKAHAEAAVNKTYKAELKAEDKSGQAASNFHHNLEGAARGHYNAKLTAIDQASGKAKSAGSALSAAAKPYHASIIVSSNAAQVASAAEGAMNIPDTSATIRINTVKTGGSATGGPMFAGGGADTMLAAQQQRAAEKATTIMGGASRRITQPTYLVGEQAPSHPEYVLAMNPAYRNQNERYLEDAAGHMGKEVIPAYAKSGKSQTPKKSSGGGVQARAENAGAPKDPGPPPAALKEWQKTHKLPNAVNHGAGIKQFTTLERNISSIEGAYNAELSKEEREIEIYKNTGHGRSSWNFKQFKGWRQKLVADEKAIVEKAIPQEIKDVGKVQKKAETTWASAHGHKETAEGKVKAGNKLLQKEETIYNHMHAKKGESSHDFSNRKLKYKTEIEKQKVENKEWEEKVKMFKEKMDAATALGTEAKEEIATLKEEGKPTSINNLAEQENELATLGAIEGGELEAPYAEAPEPEENMTPFEAVELRVEEAELAAGKGAATNPAVINAKKEALSVAESDWAAAKATPGTKDDQEAFQEFKTATEALQNGEGNVGAGAERTIGEETATQSAARAALYQQFASNITAKPAYLPGGPGASMFDTAGTVNGPSTSGTGGGTVQNVTNNFAAPPPDPHTFSKNLAFELNA